MEFEKYWCCLNERERDILAACIVPIILGTGYIDKVSFDALWVLFGITPDTAMQNSFVDMYALTLTLVEIEGVPVPVYEGDLTWWALFYAFSLTDPFICIEPCFILRYSSL